MKLGLFLLLFCLWIVFMSWYFQSSLRTKVELQSEIATQSNATLQHIAKQTTCCPVTMH